MAELNSSYLSSEGKSFRRLGSLALNLEDPAEMERFAKNTARQITIPGGRKTTACDPLPGNVARVTTVISQAPTNNGLVEGFDVLVETLRDLLTSPPLREPRLRDHEFTPINQVGRWPIVSSF